LAKVSKRCIKNIRKKTCYLDSALQQLYACTEFRDAVLNYDSSTIANPKIREIFRLYQQVLRDQGDQTKKKPINIESLAYKLNESGYISFDIYSQQDTADFMYSFLEILESVNKNLTGSIGCKISREVKSTAPNKGLKYISDNKDFYAIPVNSYKFKSVKESLKGFITPYLRTKQYETDDGRKIDVTITNKISKLSQILMLHLNRFSSDPASGRGKKLLSGCQIQKEINMYDFLSDEAKKNYKDEKLIYELFGIILHQGNMDFGHYISLIKDENIWKNFNDQNTAVKDVNDQVMEEILDHKSKFDPKDFVPYILFYRQKTGSSYGQPVTSQPNIFKPQYRYRKRQ
jgi:ubiquitin C-terminal hydrolase